MFTASCPCGVTTYHKDKIAMSWCKKVCVICKQKMIIVNQNTKKIVYNFNNDHRSFFVFCPCKSIEFLEKKISFKWGSKVCNTCNKRVYIYVVDVNTIDVECFYDFNKNHIEQDFELVQNISTSELQEQNEKLCKYLDSHVPILPKRKHEEIENLDFNIDDEPTLLFTPYVDPLQLDIPEAHEIDIYETYNNLPKSEIDELINIFAKEHQEISLLNQMYNDYVIDNMDPHQRKKLKINPKMETNAN